jgi:aquaporin Z
MSTRTVEREPKVRLNGLFGKKADHSRRVENVNPDERPEEKQGALAEARRLVTECFGTFTLTFVAAGAEMIAVISQGEVSAAARAVAPGLTVMALIYAVGDVSGAHFNPAVSVAFALHGAFRWMRVPGYVLAQLAGATAAALALRALYGNVNHTGATTPDHGVGTCLIMEIVLTLFLATVILGTATRKGSVGPNAAIAVGATISLCGLFAAPISGASMNPARSFGPALVGGAMSDYWIYLAGPLAGATVAAILIWFLRGSANFSEEVTATGKGED